MLHLGSDAAAGSEALCVPIWALGGGASEEPRLHELHCNRNSSSAAATGPEALCVRFYLRTGALQEPEGYCC
jgi:hypothetical protein